MPEPLHILVIEDSNADFLMVERHLKKKELSVRCRRVDTLNGLKEAIKNENWDMVLSDYNVPQLDFHENLNLLHAALPDLPVIMVTGTVGEEKAVELLKLGVRDFVLKENLVRLVPAIERCLRDVADYSAKKETIESLRLSEERFQLAMRGANDGLWDLNLLTNETYFSPRWKSMLGYADEELENRYDIMERLLHPEDLEPTLSRLHDYIERPTSRYEVEFRMRHKNGHYVDILSRAFMLDGEHGEALRMVGTHVDITERKKLEKQYRQAQKMEAIGQLAGGVAHDFNNILQAILGYSHLILAKAKDNEPVKHYVEELIKASNRAADLTKGLLAFSRKQEVTLAVIDISEVIKSNEAFLRRLIREDIELKLSCSEEPLTVLADRGQIEQVFMNLVTNGRDAMPNGGRLSIETRLVTLDQEFIVAHGFGTAGIYSSFSVSDSGFGMDKETQSHVFEPFFTTKEQGEGTGLGLSMAYGIVKKHDGFITVYSEPGTGTIFKIYLPLVQASAFTGNNKVREVVPLRGGTETILVGEDDAALRRLSKNVLSHYGYRVIEAVDGQDAVDKFVEHRESIALVILDAIMPKKNGKLACDEMRIMRPDLKVLFVSGYTKDIFAEGNVFDDNSVFIQKPVPPDVLLARVREILDKRTAAGGGI